MRETRYIGGRTRELESKVSPDHRTPGGNRGIPTPRKLVQRRFLPVGAGMFTWIDDDGHEREHHVENDDGSIQWSKWHRFENANGKFFMIRCPATLEDAERDRICVDIPEGSVRKIAAEYRGSAKPSKPRAESTWED